MFVCPSISPNFLFQKKTSSSSSSSSSSKSQSLPAAPPTSTAPSAPPPSTPSLYSSIAQEAADTVSPFSSLRQITRDYWERLLIEYWERLLEITDRILGKSILGITREYITIPSISRLQLAPHCTLYQKMCQFNHLPPTPVLM